MVGYHHILLCLAAAKIQLITFQWKKYSLEQLVVLLAILSIFSASGRVQWLDIMMSSSQAWYRCWSFTIVIAISSFKDPYEINVFISYVSKEHGIIKDCMIKTFNDNLWCDHVRCGRTIIMLFHVCWPDFIINHIKLHKVRWYTNNT